MFPPKRAVRRVIVILACVPALLGACAPRTGTPLTPAQNNSSGEAPAHTPSAAGIQFMAWGSAPQLQAYQTLVARYEQRFPGQTVDLVSMPGEEDAQKRLATDFTAGTPPDVIVLSYLNLAGYASRKLLAPIASYIDASQVISAGAYIRQAVGPFVYDRQLQCLPQSVSGLVVYYNKSLFQQAGVAEPRSNWNWDQFLAVARSLTRDVNGDGQPDQYGLGVEPTLSTFAPFIWQNKGSLVDDGLWPSELAFDTPAVLTATTWLVSLQTQYHVVPDTQAELASSSEQRFLDGTLAMFIGPRAGVPTYRQITAFDWDVAPLPANNGRATNVVLADGYCLTAASAHKAAAWQFIEFAASPEGEAIVAKSGAIVPALTAVAESPAFLDPGARPAHSQVYLDAVAQAQAMPLLENWSDIRAIADEELRQAYYGQKGIAQALAAAITRSEEYFMIHVAP